MSKDNNERKPRRVVRLSRVDQERLERGEFASPEDAVHQWDLSGTTKPAGRQRAKANEEKALSPRDREILGDRPPHFGKL